VASWPAFEAVLVGWLAQPATRIAVNSISARMPNLPLAELVEKGKRSASSRTGPVWVRREIHITRSANTHKKAA
jgi:hypothetical protein